MDFSLRVTVPSGQARLDGELSWPKRPQGVVVFAHGSGSSRLSPRNGFVARQLRGAGFATLLLDLLTPAEDQDRAARFDIELLTTRLADAVRFVQTVSPVTELPVGLFGASTGAAAALKVAAVMPDRIGAVVSRGGRPDLAGSDALTRVRAPSLLIVGSHDHGVIELNQSALEALRCTKELAAVAGATHLFEEPGTLARAAALAADWFKRHLVGDKSRAAFIAALAHDFGVKLAGPDALIRAVVPHLVSQAVLDEVLALYDTDTRFYHHAWHLHDLFDRAERGRLALTSEQCAALLFHDAVYVPGAAPGQNELQSAHLLRAYAGRIGSLDLEAAADIILDTAEHRPRSLQSATVCDLDLAPLADDADRFALYDELVYLEYRHLLIEPGPADSVRGGPAQAVGQDQQARRRYMLARRAFLLDLAQRASLYSPRMSHLEAPARRNIESYPRRPTP